VHPEMGNITIGMIILAIVRLRGFFALDGFSLFVGLCINEKAPGNFSSGAFFIQMLIAFS